MPHQVLELHRVSARCFDLSGTRTGSIRDQLLRSGVIVQALADEGLIGEHRPLLVCGAGAAGMNAAMVAARRKVEVLVLERGPDPFHVINSTFRRVDPTEYDWPHTHWRTGRFPVTRAIGHAGVVLRQPRPRYASELVSAWRGRWRRFQQRSSQTQGAGHVDLRIGVDASNLICRDPGTGHHVDVTGCFTPKSTKLELKSFGAVLSCVGHGEERVADASPGGDWNGYVGMQFWRDRDGIRPRRPLPPGVTRVVVSGGGDGAMQDIQRILTSYCGRQLYARLEQAGSAPGPEMLLALLSVEESARRQSCWIPNCARKHDAALLWHLRFEDMVEAQVRNLAMTPGLVDHLVDRLFRSVDTDQRPELWWVYDQAGPGHAYALNRYLVLLLIRLAQEKFGSSSPISVLPRSRIKRITSGGGHVCGDPSICLGRSHEVQIDGANPVLLQNIDMIVVRHGIEPSHAILNQRLPVPEQLSPFDIPH